MDSGEEHRGKRPVTERRETLDAGSAAKEPVLWNNGCEGI
jgi:hypothetical protein